MHRSVAKGFVVALVLTGAVLAQSQSGDSLGDVARANRSKQQAQEVSGNSPRVITNQDLPSDPPGVPEEDPSNPMTVVSGVKRADRSADQGLNRRLVAEERAGEQWKARIQDQENRVADLQSRIDRVNGQVRAAAGTAQYDTPANRTQAIQMERLANLQQMLDQQKRRLEAMQDAARRAGTGQ